MQIQVGIISVSDRATQGVYEDAGGPALNEAATGYGWEVLAEDVVPDEIRDIQRALRTQVNKGCQLILTTGGTGVAPRDVTPEAVLEMAVRELPDEDHSQRHLVAQSRRRDRHSARDLSARQTEGRRRVPRLCRGRYPPLY
jgi:molybdenum cofactor synthesis domain-containing protein